MCQQQTIYGSCQVGKLARVDLRSILGIEQAYEVEIMARAEGPTRVLSILNAQVLLHY